MKDYRLDNETIFDPRLDEEGLCYDISIDRQCIYVLVRNSLFRNRLIIFKKPKKKKISKRIMK